MYAGLALLAQAQSARTFASVMAWGFNVAIVLQLLGQKAPVQTGWPPPVITDTSIILPTGNSHAPAGSNPSGGSGPGGGPVPSGPNTLPPGQAPPPNQGTIFPPGSGNR